MIGMLLLLALALIAFALMARLLPKAPADPKPRGVDLLKQHRCRPPDSYEHTINEWITRRALGDEWRCSCGRGWRVTNTSRGLWASWSPDRDLDQEPTP